MKPPRKSTHHLKVLAESQAARKALLNIDKLLDDRRDPDTGAVRSPEELLAKAQVAAAWLQRAENHFTSVRVRVEKELEHRTREADPDVIRANELEAQLKQLSRRPRRRRKAEELAPEVWELHDEGLIPMAIADALKTSDSTVRKILNAERPVTA
jgi:DNA invertase Pin-like site-specific DNA recombinase